MDKLLKRLVWRAGNLTWAEFWKSWFPEDVNIDSIDIDKYARLYSRRITHDGHDFSARPFVLIKPSGLSLEQKIKKFLDEKHVRVSAEHDIDDYEAFSISLYRFAPISQASIPGNYLWLANDSRKYFNRAKCIVLDPATIDVERIREFKKELRRNVGEIKFYRVHYNGMSDTCFSSFVHMPEKHELSKEYYVLEKFLKMQHWKNRLGSMDAYSVDIERAHEAAKCMAEFRPAMQMNGRGVLFLTERCNMDCLYCRRSNYRKPDFTVEGAKELISQWAGQGCKYMHVTGGEVTVFEGLENIVEFAQSKGMQTSMSTNGLANLELYRRLVERGAKYFYISLDTNDESECDWITKRKGSFRHILSAIGELVRMRESGSDVYLTINVLVGDYNFSRF
ncbi:radical SAM protein, partial [Candidatus Woesearchaeota archaeon]|nr:radical SAM protein [Candidatus Woesearchaeota archaeon]